MTRRVHRVFAADHPTGPGHFPGNPIIPGALLLSEVVKAIFDDEGRQPNRYEIASAKFLRPVRPGETVVIAWETTATGGITFDCRLLAPDAPVLSGTLKSDGAVP